MVFANDGKRFAAGIGYGAISASLFLEKLCPLIIAVSKPKASNA